MHQRKEKSSRSSQSPPEAVLNLLPLLEANDYQTIDSVKSIIQENLSETKDSRLLHGIVDYYMTVESQRSLDILLRLKEPHDKYLFDKISELMKSENYRFKSLQLLVNLVYKQPPWLHKIANHRIMNTLVHLLKSDTNAPNLMSGLFILICLLPMIPSQFGPYLSDTFDIFSRMAAWSVKKPSFLVDDYLVHLQIVIYSLFHRLYGMFPCNFLAYLRSFYGGRDYSEDNYRVFTFCIKPMLERVRLHPLLVTASKETELSTNRWKKMAYHDIIVECASISLDAIEGTAESINTKTLNTAEQNFCSYESAQYLSFSSQSSCSVNIDSECMINENMSSQEPTWSPHSATTLSTLSHTSTATSPLPLKNEQDFRNYCMQLSTEETGPLDFAVEAKPELLKMESLENSCDEKQITSNEFKNASIEIPKHSDTAFAKSIPSVVEVKEDDADKEVSELTSEQISATEIKPVDVRHDTPFCSTTQNLTDEPSDLSRTVISDSSRSDSLTKSNDEETDDMYNSLQEADMDVFSPALSRYRFFSHCGPPPDIPASYIRKPKVFRSHSCPAGLYPTDSMPKMSCDGNSMLAPESIVVTCCNSSVTTTSAFVPMTSNTAIASDRVATYQELIPMALNPLPDSRQLNSGDFETHFNSSNSYFSTLSPPELLDRYVQLGSSTSLNQLSSLPITSAQNTDWTRFGGKPPPDEITILRNQLLLLHNQLLFERHRKDVHSERNRRILGRAKRFRMQEEHIVALKEQMTLLEQDNRDLKLQVEKKTKWHQHLQNEKEQIEMDLLSRILKAEQDNAQLQFSNKNLQNLLVSQKQENDEIREWYKRSQSDIINLKHQVERAARKALQCQQIEKDSIYLSKQVILLQELIEHYKNKLPKEIPPTEKVKNLLEHAAFEEIRDLKQKLDEKCFLLETTKTKLADLEQLVSNTKVKQKEETQTIERLNSIHEDEILIREERLKDLRKIYVQKDTYILSLQKDLEILEEEKRLLERKVKPQSNSVDNAVNATYQTSYNSTHNSSCDLETNSDPKVSSESLLKNE